MSMIHNPIALFLKTYWPCDGVSSLDFGFVYLFLDMGIIYAKIM